MVKIQFGKAHLGFCAELNLKNTVRLSLEDMNIVTLPPSPAVPLYLIVRDGPSGNRYLDVDFVGHGLSAIECV